MSKKEAVDKMGEHDENIYEDQETLETLDEKIGCLIYNKLLPMFKSLLISLAVGSGLRASYYVLSIIHEDGTELLRLYFFYGSECFIWASVSLLLILGAIFLLTLLLYVVARIFITKFRNRGRK